MPAAQPSVRATSADASSVDSGQPAAAVRAAVSRASSARVAASISSTLRSARRRATGSRGATRPATARWNPGGRWLANVASASRDVASVSRCASSMTSTAGCGQRWMSASRRGTANERIRLRAIVVPPSSDPSMSPMRASAEARYATNTVGSLSAASTVSHATGRASRLTHCASTVVLP